MVKAQCSKVWVKRDQDISAAFGAQPREGHQF